MGHAPDFMKGKLMANRSRTVNFHMYFSEEEFELLQRKVELSGLHSKADFIRSLVIHGAVFSLDFRELHQTNWLFSNMANNLNQIAHQANSCGMTTNSDLQEAKRIMDEVWGEQKKFHIALNKTLDRL